MCIYTRMYVCTRLRIYVYMHWECMYGVCMCVRMYICMHACMYVCPNDCWYVRTCACVCPYIEYPYICMRVFYAYAHADGKKQPTTVM